MLDTIVIGAGITGLSAAIRLAEAGQKVSLVTFGMGGMQLSPGTVDVLGYNPEAVGNPLAAATEYAAAHPKHPYRVIGSDYVAAGVEYFTSLFAPGTFSGSLQANTFLPTAAGSMRPTALYPTTMEAGRCQDGAKFTIVGPYQYKDFYPQLIAGNLSRGVVPGVAGGGKVQASGAQIDFAAREGEADSSPLRYAQALDDPRRREELIRKVAAVLPKDGSAVGLPAFLGYQDGQAWREIAEKLGRPVFEIPCLPPSPGGLRLQNHLLEKAKDLRVRVIIGAKISGFEQQGGRITKLVAEVAGHQAEYRAANFLYAAGGFESGTLEMDSYYRIYETVFGLPLAGADLAEPTHGDYWGAPQPVFEAGVLCNENMQVIDPQGGQVVYENLYAGGGILAGATRWEELSGEGIALGSMWAATQALLGTAASKTDTEAK